MVIEKVIITLVISSQIMCLFVCFVVFNQLTQEGRTQGKIVAGSIALEKTGDIKGES